MPFAYAGTRRRRNRDRRRSHDAPQNSPTPQNREGATDARDERDPLAARRASSEENPAARDSQRDATRREDSSQGIGSQDLNDPGTRDPDAPPADDRS